MRGSFHPLILILQQRGQVSDNTELKKMLADSMLVVGVTKTEPLREFALSPQAGLRSGFALPTPSLITPTKTNNRRSLV